MFLITRSSDPFVAANSIVFQEYSDIKCANPKLIVDAGANIGTTSIHFARKFPNAQIFAIEPEKENFELLQENTKKFPNVTAIMAAIWSMEGWKSLKNRQTGQWGYTISETTNQTEDIGQEVSCITVNSLISDYNITSIDILKMDIEGVEKEVLESA